jgi:rhodanese-related sulfurtransferase
MHVENELAASYFRQQGLPPLAPVGYTSWYRMDRTPPKPPSPSTIRKPPTAVTVIDLRSQVALGTAPALVDVRDPKAFHPRHIAGSQNAPESQTTALVKKVQTLDKAVLICDDGRLSSIVARTLGFIKINSVAYLEGGINAWAASGGKLVETTRTGFEHELSLMPEDPDAKRAREPGPTRWLKSIKDSLFGGKEE